MPDRARVAVLLGAGASKDAGLPVTLELTEEIIDKTYTEEHLQLLRYVQRTLEAHAALPESRRRRNAQHPIPPFVGDIERLFAAVELLIARNEQPWSPFVAAWDSGLESFSVDTLLQRSALRRFEEVLDERYIQGDRLRNRAGDALESAIRQEIEKSRPNVTHLLREIRREMIDQLRHILMIPTSSKVAYLMPLAHFANDDGSLIIATLNYDLSEEMAARSAGLPAAQGSMLGRSVSSSGMKTASSSSSSTARSTGRSRAGRASVTFRTFTCDKPKT